MHPGPPEQRPIFAVDDDPLFLATLRRLARRHRRQIYTYRAGADAIADVAILDPSACICDLHMPGCSGIEVLTAVAAHGRECVRVLITGDDLAQVEARHPGVHRVAHAVLSKANVASGLAEMLQWTPVGGPGIDPGTRQVAPGQVTGSARPRVLRRSVTKAVAAIALRLLPAEVDAITAEVGRGGGDEVVRRAHKLKGSCLSLGALEMAHICSTLERASSPGERSALVVELREGLRAILGELRDT